MTFQQCPPRNVKKVQINIKVLHADNVDTEDGNSDDTNAARNSKKKHKTIQLINELCQWKQLSEYPAL